MNPSPRRRDFLKLAVANAALAVGTGLAGAAQPVTRPATRPGSLRVAFIGAGGRGGENRRAVAAHPAVRVVGLCDVDAKRLADAAQDHPGAKTFADFRALYDELRGEIDAVVVSTPDHTHAAAAMEALNRDLHVYCEKPLTHDVYEARRLAKVAAEKPHLATQMGTQHAARVNKRQASALLADPALREKTVGRVSAVFAWSDRPAGWWPQGVGRPEDADPVATDLSWDSWLGVAPERPFAKGMYHPFDWRGCYDFGCGALGDMACHILDVPYYGLSLGHATSVVCHAQDATGDRFPSRQEVVLTFPGGEASGGRAVPLYWTDGGIIPHHKATRVPPDLDVTSNACVVVGDRGSLHVSHPEGQPRLFVEKATENGKRFVEEHVTSLLPRLEERDHHRRWIDAALGEAEGTQCGFEAVGPLVEALAVGAIAARFPHETLAWDAAAMRFPNKPEADQYVRREYRDGFKVKNL